MVGQKVTFDIALSNKIFKANLTSLIKASSDNIKAQKKLERKFINNLHSNKAKDWFEKGSHFANIEWLVLNSSFLASYSFFEYHLFALARTAENKIVSKIRIDDITGKGITKFCNYLFLVGNIESANRSKKEWQEITYFQKVRNLIAHNGGLMITDTSKKLENHECYNFLKKHNVNMAGTLGYIRIRDLAFLKSFSKMTAKLSDQLTKELTIKIQ